MCTGDLVKQGLFQLHVPGTNRATPARFCPQVRLHIPSLRDQAPRSDVWAASVGGDTETGGAPTRGAAPQTSAQASHGPGRKPGLKKGVPRARLTCRECTSRALILRNTACSRRGVDSLYSFLSATHPVFPRSCRRALGRRGHWGQGGGPSTPRLGGGDKAGRGRPPPGACGARGSVCRARRTDSAGSLCVREEDAGRLPWPGPAIRSVRRHGPLRPWMLSRSLAPLSVGPGA